MPTPAELSARLNALNQAFGVVLGNPNPAAGLNKLIEQAQADYVASLQAPYTVTMIATAGAGGVVLVESSHTGRPAA